MIEIMMELVEVFSGWWKQVNIAMVAMEIES